MASEMGDGRQMDPGAASPIDGILKGTTSTLKSGVDHFNHHFHLQATPEPT